MRLLTDEEHCEALDALYATLPEKYTTIEIDQWRDKAILKAQIRVTLKEMSKWLQGFHCPECSTPGFKAYILPTKIDDLLKDGRVDE